MTPKLVAIAGPLKHYQWELTSEALTIGRDLSNDVCVSATSVSRQHCIIRRDENGFVLEDLKSRNGTAVNGKPAALHQLSHGDKVAIGDSIFVFSDDGQEVEMPSPGVVEESDFKGADTSELKLEDSVYLHPTKLVDYSRTAELARHLNAILTIATKVASSADSERVQREILQWLFEVTPAKCAAVLLTESGTWPPTWQLACNRDGDPQATIRVSSTVVTRALSTKTALLINDAIDRPDLKQAQSVMDLRARSIVCVPLMAREGAIGVLYLDTRNSVLQFDRTHLELLSAIATIAGLAIDNANRVEQLRRHAELLRSDLNRDKNMVGETASMKSIYQTILKVARSDTTVLVLGESGTGKELAARAIHHNSPRAEQPFVAINCATLGENLLESELFGHERGAFTGAVATKKGQLEVADRGTVFLDEIAEAPLSVQAKLLRVLQEREFTRMGGTKPTHVNVRLIAATNKDMRAAVREARFREDLWYRLNVVSIKMPPLRERRDDIPLLVEHFIAKASRNCGRLVTGISPQAKRLLLEYDWPGNVRELENTIERAVVLGSSDEILAEDLPETLLEAGSFESDEDSYHASVRDAKRKRIVMAMDEAGGNYTHAARILGVHPTYLHRLIRNLGLKGELVQKFASGKSA
jgi:transcriptional regulator with GAF, ATPase, and Fis domain